jgi:F0F1-type ATP synthase delta subunit
MPLSRKLANYILQGKASIDDVIELLAKYDLLTLLPFIKQSLTQMSSGVNKDETVMIETPFALSVDSVQKIKEIAGDSNAPHTVIINKNILAGFKAKYKGMMYDGSAERIIKQITSNH